MTCTYRAIHTGTVDLPRTFRVVAIGDTPLRRLGQSNVAPLPHRPQVPPSNPTEPITVEARLKG